MKNIKQQIHEITVAEYSALYTYFNTLANIRLISFSFFITAVGFFIVSSEPAWWKPVFLLLITVIIWSIELRNRALVTIIKQRGCEIEDSELLKCNFVGGIPFFHRMSYQAGNKKIKFHFNDPFKVFGFSINNINLSELFKLKIKDLYLFTHSFIFDSTFLFTILFCLFYIIINVINCL